MREDEVMIDELDGPPRGYFEIPLDYWATPNGELEPENHPQASRLVQRITYLNFLLISPDRSQVNSGASTVLERVKARLKEIGGGYIWWRKRPTLTESDAEDGPPARWKMSFRLGTTPELPRDWWAAVAVDVGNRTEDGGVGLRGQGKYAPDA